MSDGVLAGLPRFDSAAGQMAGRAPGSWRRELGGKIIGEPAEDAPQAEKGQCAAVTPESAPAEPAAQPLDVRKIEASLSVLNARLDQFEREAQAQTLQSIQSVAAKLFPELSRRFLANEISHHLAMMVPASAAVVEIRAETELAERLREIVERSPALAHRCTVLPAPADGQGRVDVSWQAGGLTFDFDGLLQACLSHLNSTQTVTTE